VREALARWLFPSVFAERDRLWQLWVRVSDLDRWCAEFQHLDASTEWALQVRDWRPHEDIRALRERLRSMPSSKDTAP